MPEQSDSLILTLNAGSSSVKFALYRVGAGETQLARGSLERIGVGGTFQARGSDESWHVSQTLELPDHAAALGVLLRWLQERLVGLTLRAVGHRVVQGGIHHVQPERITPAILASLRQLVPLAPDHLPGEIAAMEAVERTYPGLPQIACYDTAFHRTMPRVAQTLALPRRLQDAGVLRYGFHGLSYQYLVEELQRLAGPAAVARLVIAHLGNGASLAAVRHGGGVDTTMGMTPLGGLVMGTRCGDLDPGVVLYLLREQGLSVSAADHLLNKQSGLLGVSGSSSDMKNLLDRESSDPHAAEAVALFCYQACKHIAAMTAALGGLETLVFTGGIGENAVPIRARICTGLEFLGVRLDEGSNAAGGPTISTADSRVHVQVMKTNEELMIARQTMGVLSSP